MTLDVALDNVACDEHEQGLYALWVNHNLPDVGEYQNVQGINHCTVLISKRKGILGDYPDWIDQFDANQVQAKRLCYIPL